MRHLKPLLIVLFSIASMLTNAATISSKSTGGYWSDGSTWVGNTVPSSTDDVIINGTVTGTGYCRNLTIASGGKVLNRSGYSETLYVYGDLINNGTISKATNGPFYIQTYGNIDNKGVWENTYLYTYNSSGFNISATSSASFDNLNINLSNGSADTIYATSALVFNNCLIRFSGTKKPILHGGNNTLTFTNSNLEGLHLYTKSKIVLDQTLTTTVNLYGSGEISGHATFASNCNIDGNFTIKDTITNNPGYSVSTHLSGNITNLGAIIFGSGTFTIYLDGNLNNEGTYFPNYTYLSANKPHYLSQKNTTYFQGNFYISELDTIVLNSDILFKKAYIRGNVSTGIGGIKSDQYLMHFDSSNVESVNLYSNDEINLNGSVYNGGRILGTYTLLGVFDLHGNSQLEGTITNNATIYNKSGYSVTTTISGKLINNGWISNNLTSGLLYVNLNADIENNGYYHPQITYLKADKQWTFSQNDTSAFRGRYIAEDTLGGIILGSSSRFLNAEIFWKNQSPYASFTTNGNTLSLKNCNVNNVRFHSNDTLDLDKTILSNTRTYMTPITTGNVIIYNNVSFMEGFTNMDTMYEKQGYSVSFEAHGPVKNYGAIIQNPISGSFSVKIFDSLYNAGTYAPDYTYFSSDKPVQLSQNKSSYFEGTYFTNDTLNGLQLQSDITFKKATLNGYGVKPYAKILTNGHTLTIDSGSLNEFAIVGPDTINGHGSTFEYSDFFLSPVLKGTITLGNKNEFIDGFINLDTLQNASGYGIPVNCSGTVTNIGVIRTNPRGGTFQLNLHGNIHNAGIYAPNYTYVSGQAPRYFSQDTGTFFEGKYYAADTADGIILSSNVVFKNVEINWHDDKPYSTLNANGYSLSFIGSDVHEVQITNADTLDFDQTALSYTSIAGNPVTKGLLNLGSHVHFNDDFENQGTLQNKQGYGITTFCHGEITNEAYIKANSVSGTLNLYLYKGLKNNAFFEPTYVELHGQASRTIGGTNGKSNKGTYYVKDSVTFVGENYLPNLRITNPSILTIDSGALLICNDIQNDALQSITNEGSIISKKPSSSWAEIKYHKASVWFYNTNIQDLLIESIGGQQHPSVDGAATMWWRLKPNPVSSTDSLKTIVLSYQESKLNGNPEASLRVYFSPNAGITWEKVTKPITVDTAKNSITISNANAYGHYVISSKDLGIISHKPTIQRAEPRLFGNKGMVTVYGFGIGLTNDMVVSLVKSGTTDLLADTAYITDAFGESFTARFNVDLADTGTYSLRIVTHTNDTLMLQDYFNIEEAERPKPWVMLSGRDRFLVNRWQTFKVNYGNLSNTDAQGVPLFFVVNDVPGMEVDFPDVQIGVPKSFTDDGWTQWQDTTIDLYYTSDSLTGFEGKKMRIYPFYIPSIGALSSNQVRVKIKAGQDLEMTVWVTDPLIEGFEKLKKATTPPEVAACLAKVAAKYAWDKAIDFIPGYDCYKLAYKVAETGVSHVLKDPNEPDKPETWGSWLISGWGWAWSVVDCAGDLIPVTKGVKIAKDLVSLGFDIKSNYDADKECWEKFKAKHKGKHKSRGVNSFDPNEIAGPGGYGEAGYIGADANLVYTVYFENKDSATASAQEVIVKDTINPSQFDLSAFSFNSFAIGDSTYKIQSFSKSFRLLVDLAPRINSIVQVTGNIDTNNGAILVSYLTLDRSTLELNEDVDLGFLPPNKKQPEGEGNFSYSVSLKQNIAHNANITNKALIFFDANKPIATNIHKNTIDRIAPTSSVNPLAITSTDSNFVVEWGGTDQGCGIQHYTVFVSINDSAYISWQSNTSLTKDTFHGRDKYSYKFYSIATDSLGLTERAPLSPDAVTDVLDKSGIISHGVSQIRVYPNPVRHYLTIDLLNLEKATATLWSLDGRKVLESELTHKTQTIPLFNLMSNIYVLQVEGSDFSVKTTVVVLD